MKKINNTRLLEFNSEFESHQPIDSSSLNTNGKPHICPDCSIRDYLKDPDEQPQLQKVVEKIVVLVLKSIYKNIKKHLNDSEFYDFRLTNLVGFFIEIRTISRNGTVYLGYTNAAKKQKCPWQDKARELNNGGYLFVDPYCDSNLWPIYWWSAKSALDRFGRSRSGKLKISKLKNIYGIK